MYCRICFIETRNNVWMTLLRGFIATGPRVVNSWRGGGDRGYARTPRRGGVSSRPSQPDPQPLKYTEDFDFESANALFSKDQFEKEIKSKLQIDDQKEGEANVNDHAPQEDEGRVEEVVVEGDKEENSVDENYDKTKSFFDSLTCESNKQNTNRSVRGSNLEAPCVCYMYIFILRYMQVRIMHDIIVLFSLYNIVVIHMYSIMCVPFEFSFFFLQTIKS